jgi:hypothetical protein
VTRHAHMHISAAHRRVRIVQRFPWGSNSHLLGTNVVEVSCSGWLSARYQGASVACQQLTDACKRVAGLQQQQPTLNLKPVPYLLHWHVPGNCRCCSSCWAMLHACMFLQPSSQIHTKPCWVTCKRRTRQTHIKRHDGFTLVQAFAAVT